MIGQVLVGHVIEGVVGEGGMGTVYRARHARLGRMRALKLLPPRFAEDESYRERFEREWRSAAAIEHPNIVEVLDAGDIEGQLFIVMRLIDGPDLGKLLTDEGPLEPRRTLNLLTQVADALDSANERGLVHRDVKPSNILVGPGDTAYLTDFGVAKNTGTRGLTQKGMFVGTIDYAAPEQIEGQSLDGRTDVYALGGVLYTCLTGAVPYERESEVQVIYAHLRDPPPAPSSRHPELTPALDAVVAKAMDKSRENRYGSCGELIAGLRAALRARATEPGLPVPPPPTRIEELPEHAQAEETRAVERPRVPDTAALPGGVETSHARESDPGVIQPPPPDETRARERPPAEQTVLADTGAETRLERDQSEATTIDKGPVYRPPEPPPPPPTWGPPPEQPAAGGAGGRRRRRTGLLLGAVGGLILIGGAIVAALLVLGGGTNTRDVTGKVVDDSGRALFGVRVSGGDKSVETAGDGTFTLAGVPKDAPIAFESCAYGSKTIEDPAAVGQTVTLTRRPVSGRVTNGVTGRALAGAAVKDEQTRSNGRFELYGVCPGDSIKVSKSGFLPASVRIPDSRVANVTLQTPRSIRETFSSGVGWFDDEADGSLSASSIVNSAYHIRVKEAGYRVWVDSTFNPVTKGDGFAAVPRDAALSMTAVRTEGPLDNGFGFICAWSADRYYALEVSSDGYFRIWKRNGANEKDLRKWAASSLIHDRLTRLGARCTGGSGGRAARLTLSVNGRVLSSATDPSGFPFRSFGFFADAIDEGGLEVEFDNFVFQRLR